MLIHSVDIHVTSWGGSFAVMDTHGTPHINPNQVQIIKFVHTTYKQRHTGIHQELHHPIWGTLWEKDLIGQVGNRSVRDRIATPYVDASAASNEAWPCREYRIRDQRNSSWREVNKVGNSRDWYACRLEVHPLLYAQPSLTKPAWDFVPRIAEWFLLPFFLALRWVSDFVILEWVICTTGFFLGQEFEAESSREQLRSSRDRRLPWRNTMKMQVVYSCWKLQFITS